MSRVLRLCQTAAFYLIASGFAIPANAQSHYEGTPNGRPLQVTPHNYSSFTSRTVKGVDIATWNKYNKDAEGNPDRGKASYYAPTGKYVEVLDKRKDDESYFVNVDKPKDVVIQKSYGPINFKRNGYWISIDPRLLPAGNGIYEGSNQWEPVGIDANKKASYIKTTAGKVYFNNWQLMGKNSSGTIVQAAEANWSKMTIGDEGAYIKDIFPGIDAEMTAMRGSIKTNFIVKKLLFQQYSDLIFKDKFEGSDKIKIRFLDGENGNDRPGMLSIQLGNTKSLTANKAMVYPKNYPNEGFAAPYTVEDNKMGITVSTQYLAKNMGSGGVVIDPLLSGNNSVAASLIGTKYDGTCGINAYCSNTMTVTVPAATTVVDIVSSLNLTATAPCTFGDAHWQVLSGSCNDAGPTTGWYWYFAGNTGTGSLNTSFSDYGYLAPCVPAPSCSAQSMTFTLNINRSCSGTNSAVCDAACIGSTGPWVMTIYGRTMELANITMAPSLACAGTTVGLKTKRQYGVPPYSTTWWSYSSTGTPAVATSDSIAVVMPSTNTPIYAFATDACNDTGTATFTLTPIPGTIYVDSSVAASGSGFSWASPFKTLNEALTLANNNSCVAAVWVKKGTYFPTTNTSRDSSFRILRSGLKVYGGFAGTETLLSQRNVATNLTTLSGDIGVLNDSTDNSYHVVFIGTGTGTIDSTTYLDGFTIAKGNGYNAGGSFSSNGLGFNSQDGGGLYLGSFAGGVCKPQINNCTFSRNAANFGGAIYLNSWTSPSTNTSPRFNNCAFNNNSANFNGAAIFNNGNAGSINILIQNTSFTSNIVTSNTGGAIYNSADTATISNCTFTGNSASSGGAMYNQSSYLTVSNSVFTSNRSIGGGGAGIYLNNSIGSVTSSTFTLGKSNTGGGAELNTNSTLTLSGCTFSLDSVTFAGAALRNNPTSTITATNTNFMNNYGATVGAIDNGTGTVNMTKCVFSGNVAGQLGGVVNNFVGTVTFTNCVLSNNSTTTATNSGGGAIHTTSGTTTTLNDCTLYGNTTASTSVPGGNAISVDAGSTLNLNNTIVWGAATSQIAGAGTINYSYSDVRGITLSATNLNTDPQFTNPSNPIGVDGIWGTTDDGLRLTPCSPAINAGSNALVPAGLTTDLTAATRIQNTTVEMGAYEMPYNPTGLPSTTIAMSPANPVCAATSITFTATTVAPGASPSYQWYKNNTLIGGATAATYTSSAWSNNDSIWVIHTNNDCNLKDTSNKLYIIVTPVPATPGTISGPISPCVTTAQTYSIASVGAATTYTWTVPSGWTITSGNGTATLNTTVGSAGNITVTAGNVCGTSAAQSLAVTPNAIPATPSAISGNASPCIGSSGIYSVSPITNATSYNWVVPSGWTMTAGAATPSMTTTVGSTAGNITVSATNACGTSPIQPLAVTPISNVTPSVSITANPGVSICANTSVTFTPTPVNGGTTPTYQWKKNGVNVATGSTYTTTGLVNGDQVSVVMTTSLSCFTTPTASSNTLTFTVTSIPATPGTITGNTSVCNGSSQQYSIVSVSGATNYTWTLPSGWTGGNTGPSVLATAGAGSGNITVTANNLCGASAPASLAVTATSIPATPAAITGSATPCANTSQTYSVAAVSGATAYNWSLPSGWAGTSTTNNITLTTGTTGGSLQVSAANLCGASAPSTLAVIPVNIPATPAAISGSATPCSGVATTYSVSAVSGATSYLWNIPIGWAGASSTPSISLTPTTTAGTLQVSSVGVCGTSAPRTLSISPIPSVTPSVSVSIPSSSICQFTAATFTAVPVNGGAAPLYQWKKNGINTGVNSSASTYSDPLLATGDVISVVMTSNATCATSATAAATNPITMTVIPQVVPGININAIPPIVLCAGTPITFTTNITGGGSSPFYQWYKNNNAIGGANGPTYTTTTLANADSLSVRLTSNAVCRSMDSVMSNKAGVTVNPIVNPAVSISANPGTSGLAPGTYVTFTATYSGGGSNPTFQWKKNGVVIGTAGGASYGVYFTGTNAGLKGGDLISVVMSSYDPCAASPIVSSNVLRMDNPTGIAAVGNWEGTISLYPNPNSGHFTIGADWGSGHSGQRVSAELINALGQVVYTTEVIPNTNQWTIEVWLNESVANGIYQLKLATNNMKLVKPVMIQR